MNTLKRKSIEISDRFNSNSSYTSSQVHNKRTKEEEYELSRKRISFDVSKAKCITFEKKIIKYNTNKQEYTLQNVDVYSLEEFQKELEDIKIDVNKIYPLLELKALCSIKYFSESVIKETKKYLESECCIKLFKLKEVSLKCENLLIPNYDFEFNICGLSVNNVDFHFYSPSRFLNECNSIVNNIENITLKRRLIRDVMNGLETRVIHNKIPSSHKEETLGWIDFYRFKYDLYMNI